MKAIKRKILQQVIEASAEPLVILRVDHPDWPVVFSNAAFDAIGGEDACGSPFAEVIEALVGRNLALEISETLRSRQETSFPVELGNREYLLALKPLSADDDSTAQFYVAFWRGGGSTSAVAGSEMHQALLKAKRRIRDLSREDPVTGLLNGRAFREVLEHDWAVAARPELAVDMNLLSAEDASGRRALTGLPPLIRRTVGAAADSNVARSDADGGDSAGEQKILAARERHGGPRHGFRTLEVARVAEKKNSPGAVATGGSTSSTSPLFLFAATLAFVIIFIVAKTRTSKQKNSRHKH